MKTQLDLMHQLLVATQFEKQVDEVNIFFTAYAGTVVVNQDYTQAKLSTLEEIAEYLEAKYEAVLLLLQVLALSSCQVAATTEILDRIYAFETVFTHQPLQFSIIPRIQSGQQINMADEISSLQKMTELADLIDLRDLSVIQLLESSHRIDKNKRTHVRGL